MKLQWQVTESKIPISTSSTEPLQTFISSMAFGIRRAF
jgi:hypothetical protein